MANATFDALTGKIDLRPRGASRDASGGAATNWAHTHRDNEKHPRRSRGPRSSDAVRDLGRWLGSIHALIESPVDSQRVAATLLDVLDSFLPCRQSALMLVEEGREMLTVAAARGMPMSLSQAQWVEQTSREALSRVQILGRELPEAELSSFLWVPVLSRGERIGVLELSCASGRWFGDTTSRELSAIADDLGRVFARCRQLEQSEAENDELEERLEARARECRDLNRQILASAGRDAICQLAISIAERAVDPSSYVLSNLQTAREELASTQAAAEQLASATEAAMRLLEPKPSAPEWTALEEALEAARRGPAHSLLEDLGSLISEVEEGAISLREIGEDFRELALGDAAPMDLADLSQIIERTIRDVAYRHGRETDLESRIGVLPPIRCQRLRLESLLVSMLDYAIARATSTSAIGIQAELRGKFVVVEVSVDEASATESEGASKNRFGVDSTRFESRLNQEIAEDHGGRLDTEALDDLVVIRLSLAADRD